MNLNDTSPSSDGGDAEFFYIRAKSFLGFKLNCIMLSSSNLQKHLQKRLDEKLTNVNGKDYSCYKFEIIKFYKVEQKFRLKEKVEKKKL